MPKNTENKVEIVENIELREIIMPKPQKETGDQNQREMRSFGIDKLGIEKRQDGDPQIIGHAAVFNQPVDIMGIFMEQVAPGAFTESIENNADVRALLNHDANFVLGRTVAGTLRLEEDNLGLRVVIDPPTTSFAADLLVSIERGDISQMSFGFIVMKETWEELDDGTFLRTIENVELLDVSPVTFPAYPQTDLGLASQHQDLVDFRGLSRAVIRATRNLPLNSEDHTIVEESIKRLQTLIAESRDSQEPANKPTPRTRLRRAKQRQLEVEK